MSVNVSFPVNKNKFISLYKSRERLDADFITVDANQKKPSTLA
jgi:hypothetical protein